MPRYFFNVYDGHTSHDQDGTDLPGPYEARLMAIKLAGEILRDEAEKMMQHEALRIEVVDERGEPVFETEVHLATPVADVRSTH